MVSNGPAPRRPAARLAAAVLLILASAVAASIASPAAIAQGPGGGYHAPPDANGSRAGGDGMAAVWSALRTPLQWLRESGRSFQTLMRLLAERSAQHTTGGAFPPQPKRHLPEIAEKAEEPPPPRPEYGGEAGAGRDRGVRIKEWQ